MQPHNSSSGSCGQVLLPPLLPLLAAWQICQVSTDFPSDRVDIQVAGTDAGGPNRCASHREVTWKRDPGRKGTPDNRDISLCSFLLVPIFSLISFPELSALLRFPFLSQCLCEPRRLHSALLSFLCLSLPPLLNIPSCCIMLCALSCLRTRRTT